MKLNCFLNILFSFLILSFISCGGDGGSGGSSSSGNENLPEIPTPEDNPDGPTDCLTDAQVNSINNFFESAITASGGLYFGDLKVTPGEGSNTEAFDGSGNIRVLKIRLNTWTLNGNFFDDDVDLTLEPELMLSIKEGCLYSNGFSAEVLRAGDRTLEFVVEGEDGSRVEETYTLSDIGNLFILQIVYKDGEEILRNEFDLFII